MDFFASSLYICKIHVYRIFISIYTNKFYIRILLCQIILLLLDKHLKVIKFFVL